MQTKINSYVGFAIKSGKTKYGVENIVQSKSFVILIDKTLSVGSKDKINVFAMKKNIKVYETRIEDFYKDKNCKAIGIEDKNLAMAIIKEMEENGEK
ncbi:MAG: hypothetical protein IJ676_03070 [Clostridia bacterium]|nr:hypothetical protein [Clostridia bacterium]